MGAFILSTKEKTDMNNHSKGLQTRYLREMAIALAREGFQTDRTHTDGLHVQLDGSPLCEVTESGGILLAISNPAP